MITRLAVLCVLTSFLSVSGQGQGMTDQPKGSLRIDGLRRFQQIDGIGVNANTSAWNGRELEPALDLLLDSMHATIWRVVVETVEKWEVVNDNNDPFTFNWEYYNKLYETPKFQKAWDMIRYLNTHGVSDKLMINFMGFAPPWMGIKVIKPEYEDEYVEMLVSFFHYALKNKGLKFGLIAPTNESEHHKYSEGSHLDGVQHARILKKLTGRMEALGIMGNIRIVAPDNANTAIAIKEFIPPLMEDPLLMTRIGHLGFHSYGGHYPGLEEFLDQSPYPGSSIWVTEWNAWCKGCDDGILGEYNYEFAATSVGHLLDLFEHGASAALAFEGYDSYYEHHAPSPFSYWGMLAYDAKSKSYTPRKNFYAIQQVSKFVRPGARRIFSTTSSDSLSAVAFYDSTLRQVTIVGINRGNRPIDLSGSFEGLPFIDRLKTFYTTSADNVREGRGIAVAGKSFRTTVPAKSIFTFSGTGEHTSSILKPEPDDWFTGDVHVHRNCGGTDVLPESALVTMMEDNDLSVISLLADMGNGEVLESRADMLKVNGKDAPQSQPGRIVHRDAEWHWDATYEQFGKQALGGHLILLGLKEAHQIWDESPYRILNWARKQGAIGGFCHFQYLDDKIQNELNCCIPIEYPVEAALGTMDFVSEDVFGSNSPNNGTYNSEAAIHAYYRLLNCGFRLGLTAGTDYPCNDNEPFGTLLTYVQVKDKALTYGKWVKGIKDGRTVVSRNGHREFIDMKVNGTYGPGDEIKMKGKGTVSLEVKWTAAKDFSGRVELVSNGKVIASQQGHVRPGEPVILKYNKEITASSWICARRMDDNGHQVHSAPVFVTVNDKPVRASAEDAQFFISWIDNIIAKTAPGGVWSRYFTKDHKDVRRRYEKARNIYRMILAESPVQEKSKQ